MPNKKSVSRNNIPSVHDDNAYEMYSWQNPNKQTLTAQFGGRLCSSAGYYPAGNSRLEPGSHAYGYGVARSQGTLYSDMSWAGPNLGPSPGSSGQMTGGAINRKTSVSGGAMSSKKRKGKRAGTKRCRGSVKQTKKYRKANKL
jgi:hypothetical protein